MREQFDEIRIEGLEVFAHHGVYESEKEQGQRFVLNLSLFLDIREAGRTDDLDRTVNYGAVCRDLNTWMQEENYDLLETVAEKLAERLLFTYPLTRSLQLELCKPEAPIALPFQNVSVRIRRGWHIVYLSIGSNLGDREQYLQSAVEQLSSHSHIRNVRVSSFLETKPYGGVSQGDFLNAAVALETILSPKELLSFLHEVENEAGRTREIHWGPRTLDLDILFYDRLIYEDEELILPHVDLENREFVLKPLCELAPNFRHPILQRTVRQMLAQLTGEKA